LLQSIVGMASHAPSWLRGPGGVSRRAYADLIAGAITEAGRAAVRV